MTGFVKGILYTHPIFQTQVVTQLVIEIMTQGRILRKQVSLNF